MYKVYTPNCICIKLLQKRMDGVNFDTIIVVMIMDTIGQRLKAIREKKGFPQKQVAEVLGVQRPNYSKIENNKQGLTPQQIKLFCEFFDVSADYILEIKVDRKKTLSKYQQDAILRQLDNIKDTIK
jgi:transcriptional regulator with XRE-family HTH domain